MPSILRKHKIIDTFTSKPTFQKGIAAFGKISKSAAAPTSNKKRKAVELEQDELATTTNNELKKRRTGEAPVLPPAPLKSVTKATKQESTTNEPRKRKHESSNVELLSTVPQAPVKPRKKAPLPSKSRAAESPLKSARAILEAFVISIPAKATSKKQPTSDESSSRSTDIDLPDDLQDLIDLHYAFLTTLSLHYAHHGTSSPSDIRILKSGIERSWGKRRIGIVDIRLILGLQQHNANGNILSICDYGNDKLCIEFDDPSHNSRHTQPLPIDKLQSQFVTNIRSLHQSDVPITSFPLVTVTSFNETISTFSRSKGASALAAIKAGAKTAQAAASLPTPPPSSPTTEISFSKPIKPSSRNTSLLDRIRAKEAHLASLPSKPTAEALRRTAALQRLEEIIPILEILSNNSTASSTRGNGLSLGDLSDLESLSLGSTRTIPPKVASFTMPMIIQHLQNSMKHPIAKEEAGLAIRLLAEEVVPNWVGIRNVGSVVGVTFRGSLRRGEWMGRVRVLLESL